MSASREKIAKFMKATTTYGWILEYLAQTRGRVPFTFIMANSWGASATHFKGVRDFENILQIIGKSMLSLNIWGKMKQLWLNS